MKSSSYRVVLVSLLMIFSSLAGCLEGDEDNDSQGKYGTVMVSTYHVGELVNAIAGSSVYVEMMSQDNIPVHDYTPSAEDKVRSEPTWCGWRACGMVRCCGERTCREPTDSRTCRFGGALHNNGSLRESEREEA